MRPGSVLGAVTCLREGKRVKPEDWLGMGYEYTDVPDFLAEHYGWSPVIDVDRRMVAGRVNEFLREHGIGLRLSGRFAVEVETGLGFLPAVWLQAAVAVAGEHASGRTVGRAGRRARQLRADDGYGNLVRPSGPIWRYHVLRSGGPGLCHPR